MIEMPHVFNEDEIRAMIRSGSEVGLSHQYAPSDDELAFICEVVAKITADTGLALEKPMVPANLRRKKSEERKLIRSISYRLNSESEAYDRALMQLLRIAVSDNMRYEVVFKACLDRVRDYL